MSRKLPKISRNRKTSDLLPPTVLLGMALFVGGCPEDFQQQLNETLLIDNRLEPGQNRGFDVAGETSESSGTFGRGQEPVRSGPVSPRPVAPGPVAPGPAPPPPQN
ncbi:MAG: hypothetical protein ACFCVE_12705 [Phycisphaerae bacterium]